MVAASWSTPALPDADKSSIPYKVRYTIKYNSLSFNWDTYTKGCASVREDNAGVPTNTCYDISTTDKGGYTQTLRHCYCQKDLCNSSATLLLNAVYIIFVLHFMK
ncbi:hypothetical protein ANCCEY_08975 [Ancylostoma ceylanicum]|uniref:Protein sleepless n=1 Tax=Ancylostoma ceylanicum TaxID=53326 RepID=A0A0D6LIU7_9BILA|nr:hypothetical protein ANCCEY_08975 [Ancylostoma ceylanicum]